MALTGSGRLTPEDKARFRRKRNKKRCREVRGGAPKSEETLGCSGVLAHCARRVEDDLRNFRIVIQYEGTRYQGWQRQGTTQNTLQGKFEALLSKIAGTPVEIQASAGRMQVCTP